MMLADRINKYYFLWLGGLIGLLLILGWSLKLRIEVIKKNNAKNLAALNQALPGFNDQSLERLKQEIRGLKISLVKLANIFDPKEKWLKKDYDLSIYFVEELGKVNQLLKTQSTEKQVEIPELEFKEKLPSESEAPYLLSQLYGLKEVITLGAPYNINFKSISPQDAGQVDGLPEVRLAKSRIELTCPAQNLLEFILQLNEIVPRPCTELLSLKYQDPLFEAALTLSNVVVDLDWKDSQELYAFAKDSRQQLPEAERNLSRVLRNSNPFFVPKAKEGFLSGLTQEGLAGKTDKPKPPARFLYRGKATLKSKEVIVIEDTLNQETVFLSQGEKIDNLLLGNFSEAQAVLQNLDNGQEITIKREE